MTKNAKETENLKQLIGCTNIFINSNWDIRKQ